MNHWSPYLVLGNTFHWCSDRAPKSLSNYTVIYMTLLHWDKPILTDYGLVFRFFSLGELRKIYWRADPFTFNGEKISVNAQKNPMAGPNVNWVLTFVPWFSRMHALFSRLKVKPSIDGRLSLRAANNAVLKMRHGDSPLLHFWYCFRRIVWGYLLRIFHCAA